MARKRSWDQLRGRERTRVPIPTPLHLDLSRTLHALDARILPPTPERPYWRVYHSSGRYLGAGKTPERAVTAALGARASDPFPLKPSNRN
jgi:hypothetical protein